MFRVLIILGVLAMASPAAARQAPSPAQTMIQAFNQLCVTQRGDPERVAAVAEPAGWSPDVSQEGLAVWRGPANAPGLMLISGQQSGEGKTRWVCFITMTPAVAISGDLLIDELGPTLATIDATQGLYVMTASAEALRRGDAAFVTASSNPESSSLLYIRPRPAR